MKKIIKVSSFFLVALIFSFNSAFASYSFNDSELSDIRLIEKYLNSIDTFASSFSQIDSRGNSSSGNFYLSRPGKLRWEYNAPVPIIIALRGSILAYYDSELDQLSHIPVDNALAGFLVDEEIQLINGKLFITSFNKSGNNIKLTLAKKGYESDGNIKLLFENIANKVDLKKIDILDPIGEKISITLEGGAYGVPLEDSLFTIRKKNVFNKRNSRR